MWVGVLCWLLSLGARAAPDASPTWHVPDQAEAHSVQAALEALWPDSGIAVVVGEPARGDEGVQLVDGEVRLVRDGRVLAASAASPEEAVALVRTWLRDPSRELGWVPTVAPEPAPPAPAPVLPEPAAAPEDLEPPEPPHRLHAGFVLRDSMLQPVVPEGLGLVIQRTVRPEWLAVAAQGLVTVTTPLTSEQDEVLAKSNRRGTVTSRVDMATLAVAAHAWVPLQTDAFLTPLPAATAGVEYRRTQVRRTTIVGGTPQPSLVAGSEANDFGVVVGVGAMVRTPSLGGVVRGYVLDRVRFTPPPDAVDDELVDPRVHEPTLRLDVLLGL